MKQNLSYCNLYVANFYRNLEHFEHVINILKHDSGRNS